MSIAVMPERFIPDQSVLSLGAVRKSVTFTAVPIALPQGHGVILINSAKLTVPKNAGLPEEALKPDVRRNYPYILSIMSIGVLVLILGGAIATVVSRNWISELGVPLGFSLWALEAWLIKRWDRRRAYIG